VLFASRVSVLTVLYYYVPHSLLGNLYSRVFKGTAFTAMVTGVLFLVPAGIAAVGGLASNYKASGGDQYSSGLDIGLKMVQGMTFPVYDLPSQKLIGLFTLAVGIGITVGLFMSGLIVYSFGRRKNAALFAF
jgi:uncharacterized membrane protein YjjB (DUF3815 family)